MKDLRILVVEDEFLLACALEENLRANGAVVVGPYCNLAQASAALLHESIDLAVLDINLNGAMVYPLAEELAARGIPFLFLTGYGTLDLPAEFRSLPRVSKPYDAASLTAAIERIAPKAC
jgi:two-component system, response regulator PdtaR